jgi:hypothetical protein
VDLFTFGSAPMTSPSPPVLDHGAISAPTITTLGTGREGVKGGHHTVSEPHSPAYERSDLQNMFLTTQRNAENINYISMATTVPPLS